MAKECLHCGLQYLDSTHFCPSCGRPTAKGFKILQIQESEFDRLRREIKAKDELIQLLVLALTWKRGEDKPEKVPSKD